MDDFMQLTEAELTRRHSEHTDRIEQTILFAAELCSQGLPKPEIIREVEQFIAAKQWPPHPRIDPSNIAGLAELLLQDPPALEDEEEPESEPDELQVVLLSEVEPEVVRWLWPGRIPLGKVTVICGTVPGKTCLALDLASRVSLGTAWPDGAQGTERQNPSSPCGLESTPGDATSDSENQATRVEEPGPGRVLLLNGEDHWGDSIRPRLAGGRANLDMITSFKVANSGSRAGSTEGQSFELERNIPVLRQLIENRGDVRLVIVDTLAAYCGPADRHKFGRMRTLVAALGKLAEECGVAVVVISSGSRCEFPLKYVWQVDRDVLDPELRLWIPMKFAGGQWPSSMAYRVTDEGIDWESRPWTQTVDRLQGVTAKQQRSQRLKEVADWLKGFLVPGPRTVKDVLEASGAFGWSAYQVKRAKLALKVVCRKELSPNGPWLWELANKTKGA